MEEKCDGKLWRTIYGGQNDGKLWKRNVMANYGGLFMEDYLWKVNYGRQNDGKLWKRK